MTPERIAQAHKLAAESRAAQNLPPTIEDPTVLAQIGRALSTLEHPPSNPTPVAGTRGLGGKHRRPRQDNPTAIGVETVPATPTRPPTPHQKSERRPARKAKGAVQTTSQGG